MFDDSYVSTMNETGKSEISEKDKELQKRIAQKFFDFVKLGRFNDINRFFASDCKTHNPHVVGSMDALIDAMEVANKEMAPT